MNADRLSMIVRALQEEVNSAGLVAKVNELGGQVQNAVNGPSEETQRQVANTSAQLQAMLTGNTGSNAFSPGVRQDLGSLRVGEAPVELLVGHGLWNRLERALGQGYTVLPTLDGIKTIQRELKNLSIALTAATAGLSGLGVYEEVLNPGESVVGIVMPRSIVTSAGDLRKELGNINQCLLDLSEALTGQREEPKVYGLHSSDLVVEFLTSLEVAAKFASIVGGIKAALSLVEKIRSLKRQASDIGLKPDTIQQIEDQAQAQVEQKIDEIHADVMTKCKIDEKGRRHEIESSIRINLNRLTNRIEKGFNFEVRTQLPPNATPEAEAKAADVVAYTMIRFEPVSGPRLISMPEPEDDDEDGASHDHKSKKQARKPKENA